MQLVRWNPVRDMFNLRHRINHVYDNVVYPSNRVHDELPVWNRHPVVDVYENDENIIIKAELPGIDKKDIAIDVEGRVLTFKGERSSDNKVENEKYYCRERTYGKFERAFTLPANVDFDEIKADYKDGVLKIEVSKPEEQKTRRITVH